MSVAPVIDVLLATQIFIAFLWTLYLAYLTKGSLRKRVENSNASLIKFNKYFSYFVLGAMILYSSHNLMLLILVMIEFIQNETVSESSPLIYIVCSSCSFIGSVFYTIAIAISSQYILNYYETTNSIRLIYFKLEYTIFGVMIITWCTLLSIYPNKMVVIIFVHRFTFVVIATICTVMCFCRTKKLADNVSALVNKDSVSPNRSKQIKQIAYTLYAVHALLSVFSLLFCDMIFGKSVMGHTAAIFVSGLVHTCAVCVIYISLEENIKIFQKVCEFMCRCFPCLKDYCATYWNDFDEYNPMLAPHLSDVEQTGNNSIPVRHIPEARDPSAGDQSEINIEMQSMQ